MSVSEISSQIRVNRAETLLHDYQQIRRQTEFLCETLTVEDFVVQSMPDASPVRWHLAHTTWFFETFVLKVVVPNSVPLYPQFEVLFNSYYNGVGEQFPRHQRGLLTRPSVSEIFEYRSHVDDLMHDLLVNEEWDDKVLDVVEIGLNHEQQHQELILTDLKHLLSLNPLSPVYSNEPEQLEPECSNEIGWISFEGGIHRIGSQQKEFCFDNETPSHQVFVAPFQLADRLVTNADFREFVEAGGYSTPQWWLSLGWTQIQSEKWESPLYWRKNDGGWEEFTLNGLRPLRDDEPVCHLSYFEADAFARWSGCRLPTEVEWEIAAQTQAASSDEIEGQFVETLRYHPHYLKKISEGTIQQLFGSVWEWTSSSYEPYPGFRRAPGTIGEYNGKFMCNQYVLRGGSCATPRDHIRLTYRNFFPPQARWQFSGLRLAKSD